MTDNMPATHTPGPWAWFGKANCHDVWLGTVDRGRHVVMAFKRWGAQGAQPVFLADRRLLPAKDLVTFEVGNGEAVGVDAAKKDGSVYRFDISGINHPDARLIAAAPALLEALEKAAPILQQYADFVSRVPADDLEMHPYRPSIEDAEDAARAAIAAAKGDA